MTLIKVSCNVFYGIPMLLTYRLVVNVSVEYNVHKTLSIWMVLRIIGFFKDSAYCP